MAMLLAAGMMGHHSLPVRGVEQRNRCPSMVVTYRVDKSSCAKVQLVGFVIKGTVWVSTT